MNKGILLILDGYGEANEKKGNAVANAKTPTLNKIKKQGYSLLKTSGESVGLLNGEMGGSEVGHLTIGAGKVVPSISKAIKDDIKSKEFDKNQKIHKILNDLQKNNADLHLIGLMSDKNIHSDINHCIKLIEMSADKAKNIYIHFITDGRDCGQYDSLKYLKLLNKCIKKHENCHILSVSGRFYAMDRENYMERTNSAIKSMFYGENKILTKDIENYIKNQHEKGVNDQYINPAFVSDTPFSKVDKKDCVFFFNFREDRLRQIGKAVQELGCKLVTMAEVGGVKSTVIYKASKTKNTLSEHLSKLGLTQVKISETTKYAHVTYFLNGGEEKPFKNEERIHVPTIETNDYALTPKMRAEEITNQTIKSLKNSTDAVIVNYSNPDMIGHTGDYKATITALEFLDKFIKKVVKFAKKYGYFILITADHGNAEQMLTKDNEPNTAHSLNDVFCSVINKNVKLKPNGELKDVAPTFIELMQVEPNKHFDGVSLIERLYWQNNVFLLI